MKPAAPISNHRKGLMLTFVGAMFITFDTPVLRLIDGPQWTVMFWRALLLCLTVLAWWLVSKALRRSPPPLVNGKSGLAIILLYAVGNLTFITAVYNTSIANVVFILALTPLFAALMSFVWFRENLRPATWIALVVALFGVAIIVWSGLKTSSSLGDLMAAATAMTMALGFTITRRTGKDMSMSPVLVGAITAIISLGASGAVSLEDFNPGVLNLDHRQSLWMLVNGMIIMPLSYSLLALGPRYITAAEVALFLLLETALAPIWVWLAVGEKVAMPTLIGGGIILTTLMIHSIYRLRSKR